MSTTRRDSRTTDRPPSRRRPHRRRPGQRVAALWAERRRHRTSATGRKALGVGLATVLALTGGTVLATTSSGQTPSTRASYAPTGVWAWYNDTVLGETDSSDQYAQAQLSGLTDRDHNAGFFLRYANKTNRVLVAVSGTEWKIEESGATAAKGSFAHAASGALRVEVQGQTLRLLWNQAPVVTHRLKAVGPGRAVLATVWQSTPGVRLSQLEASSLGAETKTPATPPTTEATPSSAAPPGEVTAEERLRLPDPSGSAEPGYPAAPAGTAWLSGAASNVSASGQYGSWRGEDVQIGGTWDDSPTAHLNMYSICPGGPWATWNKPLDVAIGGINVTKGETWAAAAKGAYDARWTQHLTKMKACWGQRDPSLLNIRFAHEMNLPNNWRVRGGEEAAFVAAITRYSALRYQILPAAKVVLCPNASTDGGLNRLDIRKLWPGRDAQGRMVANIYAVDAYNMWPHVTTAASFHKKINEQYSNGIPLGIEKHRQFAQQVGVPFAISEWSNNGDPKNSGGGGEAEVFVQQFHAWARSHGGDVANPVPGQLLYEVQFNLWTQYSFWPTTRQPRTANAYRSLTWGR